MSGVSRAVWERAQEGHLATWRALVERGASDSAARMARWKPVLDQVERHHPIRPGEAILEVGCGLDPVLDLLPSVYGFALDSLMVELKDPFPNRALHPTAGVFEALPFRTGAFDRAFVLNTLDHVRDPRAGLIEVARVLRPGGCLVLSVDTFEGIRYWRRRLRKSYDLLRGAHTKHPWVFSRETVERLLSATGFEPSRSSPLMGSRRRVLFTTTRRPS